MLDRSDSVSRDTITTPIPMPGRLAVETYDALLKQIVTVPLAGVQPGKQAVATGTLTHIRHLDPRGGRVHATLTDDQGDWALVDFGPDAAAMIEPLLRRGTRVTVAGLVIAASSASPASIAGYNAIPAEAGDSAVRAAAVAR